MHQATARFTQNIMYNVGILVIGRDRRHLRHHSIQRHVRYVTNIVVISINIYILLRNANLYEMALGNLDNTTYCRNSITF